MWAIPTGTSSAFKKKKSGKESQYMVSHPELGSDSPIGSDRESGYDTQGQKTEVLSLRDRVRSGMGDEGWAIHTDGSLRYKGRVVVPQLIELREEILREFHCSHFAVHPGGTKMYQDLRRQYYWSGMKRHVGDFVRRCLTCQKVKAEHQRPTGLLQWKWEHVTMNFVTHLP